MFIRWLPRSTRAPPPVNSLLNHHSGTGFGVRPSALWNREPELMYVAWAISTSPKTPSFIFCFSCWNSVANRMG